MPLLLFNYKKANHTASKKVWISVVLFLGLIIPVFSQSDKSRWVDSVFQKLSFERKIGQLIMMPVNAYGDASETDKIKDLITTYGIGGIVFTQGSPPALTDRVRELQSGSVVPLLIGLNAEEGLGSTLDSTLTFPRNLMLGALANDSLLYYYGLEVGQQLKALGVRLAFAPVADLSSVFNEEDPISRTYGSNPQRVAKAAVLYMKGLHAAGIISVARHSPAYELSVQSFSKGTPVMQIIHGDQQSLIPLQSLFENGCPAVFASSRFDPVFPDRKKIIPKKRKIVPESLPSLYTADYLKKNLNFTGLVFSYVPDVKVIQKRTKPGDSEIYTFLAGNDVLLFPGNIPATIRKLKKQIKKNSEFGKQLDERVKKMLALKYEAGLHNKDTQLPSFNFHEKINSVETRLLRRTLFEESITLIQNDSGLLPIKTLDNQSFASLSIGITSDNEFSDRLSGYANFKHFELNGSIQDTTSLFTELSKYTLVVAAIFQSGNEPPDQYISLLNKLAQHTKVVTCNYGSASRIQNLNQQAIIQAYMDEPELRTILPEIIFGAKPVSGILPNTVNTNYYEGLTNNLNPIGRLSYAEMPEEVGMDSQALDRISNVIKEAIENQATPGCQVIVARSGKIVYNRAFGNYTYENQNPVTKETIYDLASMTKVLATLQAVMFLYDKGMIDVNKKVSYYLPELDSTNKKDIILKDVLTHQAGLLPFVPMWQNTMKDAKEFLPQYYSTIKDDRYPYQVASNLYGSTELIDSLWKWTFESKMLEKPIRTPYPFRYSDISFWILHRLVEKLLNQSIDDFLHQNLYEPMGALTTGYKPLDRFPLTQIAPTEFDKIFRQSMVIGTVHDERAAMMGGVAGHAGLFSNAMDVAKLGQMLLQKGYYGGHQYLKPSTIDLFISKQFETSRRGLGWDKPLQSDWASPTSLFASPRTFGHTGFTGTCIWVDPEFDLVYVFLSNRVYPDRSSKLITANIRSRIQDIIYKSIFDFCPYQNPNLWSRSR
jgi:CubicO group peptidase (beta-lactamase class C family)/beta-glucosidase-like glycosyl hydrolase